MNKQLLNSEGGLVEKTRNQSPTKIHCRGSNLGKKNGQGLESTILEGDLEKKKSIELNAGEGKKEGLGY